MNHTKKQSGQLIHDFAPPEWNRLHFAEPEAIERVQLENLRRHLSYAAEQSPFYRRVFARAHVRPEEIRIISDLSRLPFTEKEDLIRFNSEFQAVPDSEIVDICLTSATSGAVPTQLCQTATDLMRLAYNEEIAFSMTGLTEQDTLLVAAALDRAFMAGLAYFMGGVRLKARVVRGGAGSAAQHWELIKNTGATAMVGVPSLMKKIADYALEKGENPKSAGIQRLIAIGEPTRDENLKLLPLPKQLEALWGAPVFSTYASTELATTFCECEARQGGHVRPELMVVEIVDEQGQPLPPGAHGEVVVTPLGVTGMPLIRFKTGDISYLIDAPCTCGRNTLRLAPVLGRKHQMLKYKGTTLFPNALLAALEGTEGFYGGYVEARKTDEGLDRVILYAAWNERILGRDQIENELRAKVRVVPEIRSVSREEMEAKVYQFDKKRKRITFFDLR
jgi:phenylacetate-CoA ligase